jgi:antirestriction protein ArdC
LTHELAHLFLGHLGPDKKLNVPRRRGLDHAERELEAESVAFIVCRRNGVTLHSAPYLSAFVTAEISIDSLDLYQIMRAAGQVEAVLGLAAHTRRLR